MSKEEKPNKKEGKTNQFGIVFINVCICQCNQRKKKQTKFDARITITEASIPN